jgi:uncharacterized damage-inducible protein DinB
MTRHPLDDAFRHNTWATIKLFDVCDELTPEQLAAPTPGTFGSIHETLQHIVSSDSWYLTFFRDEGFVRIHEDRPVDLADLRAAMATNGALWIDVLDEWPDADLEIEDVDGNGRYVAPVGIRLAQAVHHGTDHRSQICTALTLIDVEPPDIAVWRFGMETGRDYEETIEPVAGS